MPAFPVDRGFLFKLVRRRWRTLLSCCLIILLVDQSGVLVHPMERELTDGFSYPMDRPDFRDMISRRLNGQQVDVQPINRYDGYRFLNANSDKCHPLLSSHENASRDSSPQSFPRLVLVIKSSLSHTRHRDTIRRTWGFEQRFSDVEIRRIFVLGSCDSESSQELESQGSGKSCQEMIDEENSANRDILQADFIDSYYNNTIKTMVGLNWLSRTCPDAEFALFVDDDYYVSVKNLLKFARNPFVGRSEDSSDLFDFDGRLYAGFVFASSSPMRHKVSKWFVSLQEYPYSRYPPYVTAGAYLLSNQAFKELSMASNYVKHFRFDDIYMGILAKKIALTPTHSPLFHFYAMSYDAASYSHVVAAHGFDDHQELTRVWNEQKSLGNA